MFSYMRINAYLCTRGQTNKCIGGAIFTHSNQSNRCKYSNNFATLMHFVTLIKFILEY